MDPMATGRVLRLNEDIGELQAVMAQVTGCGHVVCLAACLYSWHNALSYNTLEVFDTTFAA
jgi:hypothetical protein